MKRTQTIAILVLGIVAAGGALMAYQGQYASLVASAEAQSPAPSLAVQTTTPARRNVSRLIALPGDVHPWEEAVLYAKVPGYLGSISVDKGDRVRAGQVLAVIQAPELQADREQAQQAYQSALSSAQGSRATQERTLLERRRAQAAVEKAQADYAQTPSAVARAKAQLRQTQGAERQAQEQKRQAEAAVEESRAQWERTQADLDTAQAEQKLADLTFTRYQGIYDKNPMLIAKQDVDAAESRAKAARGKAAAAQSAVVAAQRHIQVAQAQVSAAEAQIEQAQAQVAAAQEQVTSTQTQGDALQKQVVVVQRDMAISRQQQVVTQAKTRETQFQANAGRSAFGKTTFVADYARIRAPFTGVITKRYVDPGAFIQTASTNLNAAPIVTVANLDSVRVYINEPEMEARLLQIGTPVKITTTGLPDTPFTGRVARTAASLDSKTRTLLVEVDLANRDGKILSGTYATAKVALETHPNVLSVPSGAVGADKSGKFVFYVENGKAKRGAVTVGFDDGAFTEILTGLHGGEQVVVTGRDALTPNAAVQSTPWTPAKGKP